MKQKRSDPGWKIEEAITRLRATIDPYIWEQGQELQRRGAVEDFTVSQEGAIHVTVLDPRDARRFFVKVERDAEGQVRARCECPYRLSGLCRHQVVALEYLRRVAENAAAEPAATRKESSGQGPARESQSRPASPQKAEGDRGSGSTDLADRGPVLYRLARAESGVSTRADGSLLRVVLHSLGSLRSPHRLGLQLYTGTGWTELRTSDVGRWIARGAAGPHPRDALFASVLVREDAVLRDVDSDGLAVILAAASGTDALVDRSGQVLPVSLLPWRLNGRIARSERREEPDLRYSSEGAGGSDAAISGGTGQAAARGQRDALAVRLECRSLEGRSVPLEEIVLVSSVSPWIQLETGEFHPLIAGVPGPVLAELQEELESLANVAGDDLDRLLGEGVTQLERICLSAVETEPGLIEEVEGVTGARIRLEGSLQKLGGPLDLRYGEEWVRAPRTPAPWTVARCGVVHRYPPAGQALAKAQRELEAIGFHREGDLWTVEGSGMLLRILAPRTGAFVRLELPRSLDALNLVDRAPSLHVKVRAFGPGEDLGTTRGAAEEDAAAAAAGMQGGPFESSAASPGADLQAPLRRGSGIAWLEIVPSLRDGERELPIDFSALLRATSESPGEIHQLADGTVVSLDHPSVRALCDLGALGRAEAGAAAELYPGPRKSSRSLCAPLAAISELLVEIPGRTVDFDHRLRGLVDGLRGAGTDAALATARPDIIRAEIEAVLRPYQREAVRWLGLLSLWGLGGILADEMGLGKTLMALAHFFARPDGGPAAAGGAGGSAATVLVVCPSTLIFNWIDEARRFFPRVSAVGLYGESPARREELIGGGADLLVTSYALLRRDREALEATEFRAVILDEAQHIKNAESQTAQAAFALRARERWALTGTPVENHLGELWSLFHFLLPGLLGMAGDFEKKYAEPIAHGEEQPLSRLRARVRPFLLRRTKAQVLSELPPKIEQVERVPMTEEQRLLYERYLLQVRGELECAEPEKARFRILAALTRLRQICCHPRLFLDAVEPARPSARDASTARDSAAPGEELEITGGKFELLRELLEECFGEGHRVLLYSQFTSMLDLFEEMLEEMGALRCRLDGSTRDREGEVRRFASDPSRRVFLISLKAGGLGLNLTQANTVILYDPWWNPAAEAQAAARAHRLGQTVPVHVHRLITKDTVEEKILELQSSKRDLAERIVEAGEEALAGLSLEELRGVLLGS